MQITLQNTEKGQCYAVRFDRYRQQVVDKLKTAVSVRWWDKSTGAWMIPANNKCKAELDQLTYYVRHFEPVNWGGYESKTDEDIAYQIPDMPELDEDHGLKIQPYPYQLQGIARGLQLKRFINGDDMGLGKQQPVSSYVATPNSFRRIGELQIGDEIFGRDGNVYTVSGVYPQKERRVFKVTFSDGVSCECGPEHLWCVRDANRRRKGKGWITKTTQEIMDSGVTYNLKGFGHNHTRRKWEIPMCEPVKYKEGLYIIHPYIMGVLLGDGHLCNGNGRLSFSTPDMDAAIADRVRKLLPSDMLLVRDDYATCPRYNITKNPTVHENRFYQEIKRLKVDKPSVEKFIPYEYMHGSVEQRINLLRGLMDTDGSGKRNRITYSTLSYGMARDIALLVRSLGGQAIIRRYDRQNEVKGVEFQVNVRIKVCPFYLERKAAEWDIKKTNYCSRYISSIEYIREEDSVCISVTAPDHLYLTNNYIVTHNTLESIATINKAGAFPCLVICPNTVKINWQREWHKFTDKKAMVLTDSVRTSWPFFWQTGMNHVFIVNYESLRKYFVRRINKSEKWTLKDVEFHNTIKLFKSVIIDESHKVKSTATQQSKFCKGITAGKEWIILLTGTPVVNKPNDLICQLAIMDRMNDLGGWKYFTSRYCSGPHGASNLKELNFMLWKHCFFRREKSKVLTQLPDKVRQIVTCEITNRKEYQDAERDLVDYLRRYKEADDEKVQKSLKGEVMVRIGILKDITARGKLREVIDFVKDFRENGKKIILFCNLHEIVDRLLQAFPTAVCVTGRQDMQQKQAAIDAFQRNPKTDVIICSIKAAAAGITLTASSNVAFIELPWTYADCDQAESRAHRIGQKDSVNCYYLLGRKTIDQKLYRIIEEKKHISNAVLGAEDNIQTNIVDMMARIFDETEEEE